MSKDTIKIKRKCFLSKPPYKQCPIVVLREALKEAKAKESKKAQEKAKKEAGKKKADQYRLGGCRGDDVLVPRRTTPRWPYSLDAELRRSA